MKNNLGIGFVPEEFLAEYPNENGVRRLSLMEEIPHRMVCFVKRKNHSPSIASREMERMILAKSKYENG